jgi:hypothetical protein
MTRKRPTVADVRAMKGKYQYTMLRVETMQELEAAEQAGIDMVSVSPNDVQSTVPRCSPGLLQFRASII